MQANLQQKITLSLTLKYQDEAYTLAYYFLGDERRAVEAVQAAFESVRWRQGVTPDRFRREVFRSVLSASRSRERFASIPAAQDDLSCCLTRLEQEERSALVLVDVLGMQYAEAREVLGVSQKQLGKLVALGRMDLARQINPA
jgi:DNA-directed RNA polymerase specialized sigma24 family protein